MWSAPFNPQYGGSEGGGDHMYMYVYIYILVVYPQNITIQYQVSPIKPPIPPKHPINGPKCPRYAQAPY